MPVSIHTSALAATAHREVFLPWLKRVAGPATAATRLTAVLVPHRADAYYLKALALAECAGLWNVRFLTPGDLRNLLQREGAFSARVPLREHLRLLLATAAERVASKAGTKATVPVVAAPDELLKAVDLVGQAGWDFSEAGPRRLQPIAAEFRRLLEAAQWQMLHEADREALGAAGRIGPLFRELAVIGFHGGHWPLWPLLETAVRVSERCEVCLTEPRFEAQDLDAAWVGTWEQTFGAAQPMAAQSDESPIAEMLQTETRARDGGRDGGEELPGMAGERAVPAAGAMEFLVGADTAGQARAIASKALQYVADPACGRLGILFPSAGALSRRVAALLAEAGVAHNDGLAYQSPGPLELEAGWDTWLALQENPRAPVLLRHLRERGNIPFGDLRPHDAIHELESCFQEVLIDDLQVLAAYLAGHPREQTRALATALNEMPLLPERATLGEYFRLTAAAFQEFAWQERADMLARFAGDWQESFNLTVSRQSWIRWLKEMMVSWQPRRAAEGSHPYSRVHLLPYHQADAQSWTHLIAAGLNEGQWPPPFDDSGFIGEEEIAELNRQVRSLNTRASQQGSQGEGHVTVQAGKAICLGPVERRALIERQFLNTMESATVAATATMQLHDESALERLFNPSEFFVRLHFAARGSAVSEQTLHLLQMETARWLENVRLWSGPVLDPAAARQTRVAFDARRDADRGFGEYEFALREPRSKPIRLAATQWDKVLAQPAQIFLAAVLGVACEREDDETPWAQTQGKWAHRWLSALTGGAPRQVLTPLPSPAELQRRVRAAAANFRDRVTAALRARRRPVPDWWQSTWQQVESTAESLAAGVAEVQGRTHAGTEWTIEDTGLAVAGGELHVRGRIDLLLSAADSLDDVWLVDYKTGKRTGLKPAEVAAGKGIQLALYALALRAKGARAAGMSLLTAGEVLDAPQMHVAELDGFGDLWQGLLHIQETGVFGRLGPLRPEYGWSQDYPLATLAIDEAVLERKWAQSHPNFAPAEEES